MFLLLSSLIVAAAVIWSGLLIVRALDTMRADTTRTRTLQLMAAFAPGIAAAAADPRAILTWQPLALRARTIFRDEFATLDAAAGESFPFSNDALQTAHARWTADWLAWEQAHDAASKLKAATAASELAASGGSALMRARCDAVEREKLEVYQQHYADYVRVAKALQALMQP
jgi:hypothetical protein